MRLSTVGLGCAVLALVSAVAAHRIANLNSLTTTAAAAAMTSSLTVDTCGGALAFAAAAAVG